VIAVEIKAGNRVSREDLRGLRDIRVMRNPGKLTRWNP
jgi:hypothetical protein